MFDLAVYAAANRLDGRRLNVWEVGVHTPEHCTVREFIETGHHVHLVEPLPFAQGELRRAFCEYPNVRYHEFAIAADNGEAELLDQGEGSWLDGLTISPTMANHGMKPETIQGQWRVKVRTRRWDEVDPGDIDFLGVDVEGMEWAVLCRMVSRPLVVRAETHLAFHPYQTPKRHEIELFMRAAGYLRLCETVADTVWVRREE